MERIKNIVHEYSRKTLQQALRNNHSKPVYIYYAEVNNLKAKIIYFSFIRNQTNDKVLFSYPKINIIYSKCFDLSLSSSLNLKNSKRKRMIYNTISVSVYQCVQCLEYVYSSIIFEKDFIFSQI